MKSLAVSVCITAVTGMAAVSLLVFFWCSSGVLLVFFCVLLCSSVLSNTRRTPEEHQKNTRRTPEEHQKNTRRTPEEPRRTQKNPEGEEHQPPR
jgi:cytoskeletal protein RodZ